MQQYDEQKKKFIEELARQGITDMSTLADEVLKEFNKSGGKDVGIGVIFDKDPRGPVAVQIDGWRVGP